VPPVTGTARPRDGLTEVTGDGWLRPLLSTDEASGAVAIVVYPWEISLARQAPDGSALNVVMGAVRRVASIGNRARVSVEGRPAIVAEVRRSPCATWGPAPGVQVAASWKATATRLVVLADTSRGGPHVPEASQ
jgi:hypothetical protein